MGDFRIVIDAVGGHGQQREVKDGENLDLEKLAEGNDPEAIALKCIEQLKTNGCSVDRAKIIHWPTDNYPERQGAKDITDDLLTGVRTGNF